MPKGMGYSNGKGNKNPHSMPKGGKVGGKSSKSVSQDPNKKMPGGKATLVSPSDFAK